MNPDESGQEAEGEQTLMRVLTGILEDSVQTLQRIEKSVNESTTIANEMLEKIQLIDKKIESGFVAVVKKALPALETKFLERLDKVGNIGEVTTLLPDIISKIQQAMQILSIQNLINELDNMPGGSEKKESAEKKEVVEKKVSAEKKQSTKKKGKGKKEIEKEEKTEESEEETELEAPVPPSPKKEVPSSKKSESKKKEDDHLLKPSSFFGS